MKQKIITKSKEMFLRLGFKSITMDDIAAEMGISKKTIYKYFGNKELLVEETVEKVFDDVEDTMQELFKQNYNAIEENFQIRQSFKEMFKSAETSPVYQLKKHYPEIYTKVNLRKAKDCRIWFTNNIKKGMEEGLYRSSLDIETAVTFYYMLISEIHESIIYEKYAVIIELKALEYHTRALATAAGLAELEKQLSNPNL